jgi:hypothetical protein
MAFTVNIHLTIHSADEDLSVDFPFDLGKDTVDLVAADLLQQIELPEPRLAAMKNYVCDEITKQISNVVPMFTDPGYQELLARQAKELADLEARYRSAARQCDDLLVFS